MPVMDTFIRDLAGKAFQNRKVAIIENGSWAPMAGKLMKEVKSQVRSDIDFEMREKYHDQIKLEKDRIAAARAVGVAFGNGQKPTTTNLMWLR